MFVGEYGEAGKSLGAQIRISQIKTLQKNNNDKGQYPTASKPNSTKHPGLNAK